MVYQLLVLLYEAKPCLESFLPRLTDLHLFYGFLRFSKEDFFEKLINIAVMIIERVAVYSAVIGNVLYRYFI